MVCECILFTKIRKIHYGMDFTAPRGTPIYASGDGIVKRADRSSTVMVNIYIRSWLWL